MKTIALAIASKKRKGPRAPLRVADISDLIFGEDDDEQEVLTFTIINKKEKLYFKIWNKKKDDYDVYKISDLDKLPQLTRKLLAKNYLS